MKTMYHYCSVQDCEVFYRTAGDRQKPAILLLHGFPSSSHQFRELIPLLAERYYVVAPGYPGFGLYRFAMLAFLKKSYKPWR